MQSRDFAARAQVILLPGGSDEACPALSPAFSAGEPSGPCRRPGGRGDGPHMARRGRQDGRRLDDEGRIEQGASRRRERSGRLSPLPAQGVGVRPEPRAERLLESIVTVGGLVISNLPTGTRGACFKEEFPLWCGTDTGPSSALSIGGRNRRVVLRARGERGVAIASRAAQGHEEYKRGIVVGGTGSTR